MNAVVKRKARKAKKLNEMMLKRAKVESAIDAEITHRRSEIIVESPIEDAAVDKINESVTNNQVGNTPIMSHRKEIADDICSLREHWEFERMKKLAAEEVFKAKRIHQRRNTQDSFEGTNSRAINKIQVGVNELKYVDNQSGKDFAKATMPVRNIRFDGLSGSVYNNTFNWNQRDADSNDVIPANERFGECCSIC
uniref:SKIP_SNW domain-containing protein n=2 Tax=Rhabditophanes sp. KR3021 TaxID=114890 RepID=A0AC35U794_9BILA